MAHPEIEEWLATAVGVALNPDGSFGNQCVDAVDAYGEAIFGVPWSLCVGGVTGAKQLLDAAPDKYWVRVDNNPNDPNLLPPRGAVVVTSGDSTNQWGHTYIVLSADQNGADVLQQDGFAAPLQFVNGNWYSAKPAHKARMPWAAKGIGTTLGWLIPRENMIKDTGASSRGYGPKPASQAPALQGFQRATGDAAVGYRKAPDVKGELIQWLEPKKVYDFKGFVRRGNVEGNDIWFVGRYTEGFAWSGAFPDQSIKNLPDLTDTFFPKPAPTASNKRITGKDGVNRRKAADKNAALIDTFGPDLELTLGGYVIGTDPYGKGNKIWFVGGISGGYMHSSGFTSQSTDGLPKLELPKDVAPTPKPKPYDFVPDLNWVEKIPAHITNVELGRAPKKDGPTVIHQMGTPGRDTIGSTINEFLRENAFKSTHFCVSKGRGVQMVSLKDRAYHAGTVGNDWIGIETDPYQDAETIATVKRLLADLKALGYQNVYIRHREIPGNATECGSLIDLAKYKLDDPLPVPKPTQPTAPAGPSLEQAQQFVDWLAKSWMDGFAKAKG